MSKPSKVRRRRILSSGVLLAGALLLAACDPVLHPTTTVRAPFASGVTVELLAGGASHVVVSATAGGDVVPGPGNWRVDRHDGTVDALPDRPPMRISADGERILLGDRTGQTLWADGAEVALPAAGTVFSDDLTFGLFVQDGNVHQWNVATGESSVVGDGEGVVAVSDDGTVAVYRRAGLHRILNTTTGTATDLGNPDYPEWPERRVTLSASGAVAAVLYEVYGEPTEPWPVRAWIDLVDTATGEVVRHHDLAQHSGAQVDKILLSDDGSVAWLLLASYSNCGFMPPNIPYACFTAREAVVLRNERGLKRFSMSEGGWSGRFIEPSITPDGRFLTVSLDAGLGGSQSLFIRRPEIIDWVTGTSEVLPIPPDVRGLVGATAVAPKLSDDGRLVVAPATPVDNQPPDFDPPVFSAPPQGWYEFTPEEEPEGGAPAG